ncbi:MAG: GntR family transcriptional regulator [Chloroflexi bacterium]|nr:MAG: GntR family transcriptional regulator [Chloroflexota bacterium]
MRPNLPVEVADRLRRDIFSGRLRPGERIDQDAEAAALGVSRVPIREALIALDREGLVDIVPRHGVFVWSFGPEDLADQYEVFGLVSGLAAERAAQNLTDDELANLRAVHAEMSVSRDGERLELLNERFHMIINRASGSRRLAWLVRFLSGSVPRGYEAGGWQIANRHHATIIERLGARDAEGAGRAMRDHIRQSGEHALGVLAESGIWKA